MDRACGKDVQISLESWASQKDFLAHLVSLSSWGVPEKKKIQWTVTSLSLVYRTLNGFFRDQLQPYHKIQSGQDV